MLQISGRTNKIYYEYSNKVSKLDVVKTNMIYAAWNVYEGIISVGLGVVHVSRHSQPKFNIEFHLILQSR